MVAEQILGQMGLSHDAVENGEAAVSQFESTRPRVILMDAAMPLMNGYKATRRIREIEHERGLERAAIIGLTAHALQGDREKCLGAGMDDYIAKPVSIAKLTEIIAKWHPGAGDRGRDATPPAGRCDMTGLDAGPAAAIAAEPI
jgi:CheY-like chemotaxis protein